jgi:hypothetical protein
MPNDTEKREPSGLSRRSVLAVLATVAASPALATRALAARTNWQRTVRRLTEGSGRPRFLHAAVALNDGRIVVMGGYGTSGAIQDRAPSPPTSGVQLYDPYRDAWYDLAPMQTPRARHAAALLPDGRIAVLGGVYASMLSSVEIYDPRTNTWEEGPSLPAPMADHAASACGDTVVVTGGQNGQPAILVPISSNQRPERP